MDAIVLVGGQGLRLRPLTLTRHKSLMPVLGQPAIEHLFDWLDRAGFARAILAVGRFNDDLADAYAGGRPGRLRVEVVRETERLESGGAVRHAAAAAGVEGRFAVLNGDVFVDFDFQAMLAQHISRDADLSIALSEVADPWAYGVAVVDPANRILDFVEKPPEGTEPSNLINAGVWIFEAGLTAEIPAGAVRVEETLFPTLVAQGRTVLGYPYRGVWADIGTPARYLELHQALLTRDQLPWWGPKAFVDPAASIEASVLGDGVQVGSGARVANSVLWEEVAIGEHALVQSSILANGVTIGVGATMQDAVIGAGATIAPGVQLPPGSLIDPHTIVGARG